MRWHLEIPFDSYWDKFYYTEHHEYESYWSLAITREYIILELTETGSDQIAALAVAALALGGVHWLVRDQDRRVQS